MKILIYILTTLLLLFISFSTTAEASYQSGAGTKVTAAIPSKVDIRIYGYTAPYSLIQATAIRVFAQVSSDKTGYFLIDPLPVSAEASEICLATIDSEKRTGFPVCIQLPQKDKPSEIGPVLLSPTISLTSANLIESQGNQSSAQGATLPNADVEISFFENSASSTKSITSGFPIRSGMTLIPPVEAKTIAKITTKTDKTGSFSINLPATKATTFRLFAKAFYDQAPTPKSQTLAYSVLSYQQYWMKNILPKLIFLLLLLLAAILAFWCEKKTGKGRMYLAYFTETQLKPFGVRSSLTLRRIWYNWQARLRKDQK